MMSSLHLYFWLHLAVSVAVSFFCLSFIERFVHRDLSHKRYLAKWLGSSALEAVFIEHTREHHGKCFAIFNKDKGECINIPFTWKYLLIAIPAALLLPFDGLTGVCLFVMGLAHSFVWVAVHNEQHNPNGAWFSQLSIYLWLRRYHYLHHRHPNKNFNVLIPLADWLCGTVAVATEEDKKEMLDETWTVRPQKKRE